MNFARLIKRHWILAGVFVALYCVGYVWARSHHALIHRVSFATESHGKIYFHIVTTGDFGPGVFQSGSTRFIVTTSYEVFTPLRWLEAFVWQFIPRRYAV